MNRQAKKTRLVLTRTDRRAQMPTCSYYKRGALLSKLRMNSNPSRAARRCSIYKVLALTHYREKTIFVPESLTW
ncbi:MAG: hypothetical protein V6Z82_04480 [Flavobacteriales bacterium]